MEDMVSVLTGLLDRGCERLSYSDPVETNTIQQFMIQFKISVSSLSQLQSPDLMLYIPSYLLCKHYDCLPQLSAA